MRFAMVALNMVRTFAAPSVRCSMGRVFAWQQALFLADLPSNHSVQSSGIVRRGCMRGSGPCIPKHALFKGGETIGSRQPAGARKSKGNAAVNTHEVYNPGVMLRSCVFRRHISWPYARPAPEYLDRRRGAAGGAHLDRCRGTDSVVDQPLTASRANAL